MKQFIGTLTVLIFITIIPNAILGIARLYTGDTIPFVINRNKAMITPKESPDSAIHISRVFPKSDLSREAVYGLDSIVKYTDRFGFSNVVENRSPGILYMGDSFLSDHHLSSSEGLQSLTNQKSGKNICYNISSMGCSGFRVYNELKNNYFKSTPKYIILEVVERNMYDAITKSYKELEQNLFKTEPYNNLFFDLILGNNVKNLRKSKLFGEYGPKTGTERKINKDNIWFLNNQLTPLTESNIDEMIGCMIKTKALLRKKGVKIIYILAPDKESMFPGVFGTSKLGALQDEMRDNGIEFIDVYSRLKENGPRYYFAGDTHWNGEAIEVVTDSVVSRCSF